MNMRIERPFYLKQLRSRAWNGQIKVVTGIRRCGKSFLLNKLYRDDVLHRSFDEAGVLHVNLLDFILDESIV